MIRGEIVDRDGTRPRDEPRPTPTASPTASYADPAVSAVIGYASRRYGTAGLERTFGAALTGRQRPGPDPEPAQEVPGRPVRPADADARRSRCALQRAAVRGLGADKGAVVMLDPRTGEVLALASTPIYDASAIANPATAGRGRSPPSATIPNQPLLNRATQGRYVPGSVFKIVTAVAGLGSGAIDAGHDVRGAGPGRARRAGRQRLPHPTSTAASRPRRSTWPARPRCRPTSGSPSRASRPVATTSPGSQRGWASAARCRSTCRRRRRRSPPAAARRPVGSTTTRSWRTPSYGQARTLVTPLQMALVAATRGQRRRADEAAPGHRADRRSRARGRSARSRSGR